MNKLLLSLAFCACGIFSFPTAKAAANIRRVRAGLYLEKASCAPDDSWTDYVGAESAVRILSLRHRAVGEYRDAIYVEVLSNTNKSSIAAVIGCRGWVQSSVVDLEQAKSSDGVSSALSSGDTCFGPTCQLCPNGIGGPTEPFYSYQCL